MGPGLVARRRGACAQWQFVVPRAAQRRRDRVPPRFKRWVGKPGGAAPGNSRGVSTTRCRAWRCVMGPGLVARRRGACAQWQFVVPRAAQRRRDRVPPRFKRWVGKPGGAAPGNSRGVSTTRCRAWRCVMGPGLVARRRGACAQWQFVVPRAAQRRRDRVPPRFKRWVGKPGGAAPGNSRGVSTTRCRAWRCVMGPGLVARRRGACAQWQFVVPRAAQRRRDRVPPRFKRWVGKPGGAAPGNSRGVSTTRCRAWRCVMGPGLVARRRGACAQWQFVVPRAAQRRRDRVPPRFKRWVGKPGGAAPGNSRGVSTTRCRAWRCVMGPGLVARRRGACAQWQFVVPRAAQRRRDRVPPRFKRWVGKPGGAAPGNSRGVSTTRCRAWRGFRLSCCPSTLPALTPPSPLVPGRPHNDGGIESRHGSSGGLVNPAARHQATVGACPRRAVAPGGV
ncbi:hypothetical protein PHYSODRAFT_338888 [Phytophthora sojae]|uniref:Uncharacterized protein n=1 Tax=Phytophthora sojae (strain P6497) TaxID=1094619 RepID=G5A3Q6_PHYSP|nr:hypothetical protein PHYSODRAFT_338888 [Phytophthora sojae]EGZ10220.1 hypothetical protein PHYSODRAFT_338888 [Phytophthora sojae]|eukprot:XP_009535081.1 hypothetical protein PHYSODRAFT_338888 [Phytophthora sojae]